MKKITAIALLLLPIAIFSQCGIYKTLQDFKDITAFVKTHSKK